MINAGNYASLLNVWGLRVANPGDPNTSLIYDPSVCMASAGCSFSNIFGPLFAGSARYSNLTTVTNTSYTFHDLNFRVHKNDVVKMPWKNGGSLGIAFGMEHRDESLSYRPDQYITSGQAATNVQSATQGGFNVSEGYLGGKSQLLKDAAYAKDLTIDGQGRISSYNTFGSTKNWKVGINWSPSRDIRFSGTLGTSFRQPSVWNLYSGQAVSYKQAFDPCTQIGSYGAASGNVAATCARWSSAEFPASGEF
ncbi:MAG: TonB-dependent receptor [Acetobacteraceae bacterium]